MNDREQLIDELKRVRQQEPLPSSRDLLSRVIARIQADGNRLQAQSQMAETLNHTMEEALSALAVFKNWNKS